MENHQDLGITILIDAHIVLLYRLQFSNGTIKLFSYLDAILYADGWSFKDGEVRRSKDNL